ncbi:PHP domain-containing protein [Paenibacillus sp. strain BS8-2]
MAIEHVENGGMEKPGRGDLHTHTTASDGLLRPAEIVRKALACGLSAVAITDHDTIAGVEEAINEGEQLGIDVIPGIEISTYAQGGDIHVLGYWTDNRNGQWLERLESLGGVRGNRNELIVNKLKALGVAIEWADVEAVASERLKSGETEGNSIGRPHIAEALIRNGVVSSMSEAFDRFLASGAAAYVELTKIHPQEAVRWIHEAGGAAVIAHPGLYDKDSLVEELIVTGADGIEVYHPDHGLAEEKRYNAIARRYGIVATGGSDYHGERLGASYHGALGSRYASTTIVAALRELAVKWQQV